MAINQKVLMDEVRQRLILNTEIPRAELVKAFSDKQFYAAIYHSLAMKVADCLFERIGPVLDEALQQSLIEKKKDKNGDKD